MRSTLSPWKSAWHGGTFGPFVGWFWLPLGPLKRAFVGLQSVPASGGKETHLHRRVVRVAKSATSGRRRLRRNLSGTAAFLDPSLAALTAFRALAGGLGVPKLRPCVWDTDTHTHWQALRQATPAIREVSSFAAEIWMARRPFQALFLGSFFLLFGPFGLAKQMSATPWHL